MPGLETFVFSHVSPLSHRLPGIIQNFSAPSHLLAKGDMAERRGVNVPKWLALILKLSMRPRREGSVKREITENLCKAEKTKALNEGKTDCLLRAEKEMWICLTVKVGRKWNSEIKKKG